MAYKILNSEAVSVFPISNVRRYSDESVDNRARAISEYNLTNLISSMGRNDFVKSIKLKDGIYDIEFILHGYYFRIALEKDKISSYQDTYAMIKLYVPSENPITYSIGKDIKNSSTNEYQFNGLYITNSNNEHIESEDNTIDIKANYAQYYLKLLSLSDNNIKFNSNISDYKNSKYLYNYFDDNFKLLSSDSSRKVLIVPIESIRDYEFYAAQAEQDKTANNHNNRITSLETIVDGGYEK